MNSIKLNDVIWKKKLFSINEHWPFGEYLYQNQVQEDEGKPIECIFDRYSKKSNSQIFGIIIPDNLSLYKTACQYPIDYEKGY